MMLDRCLSGVLLGVGLKVLHVPFLYPSFANDTLHNRMSAVVL